MYLFLSCGCFHGNIWTYRLKFRLWSLLSQEWQKVFAASVKMENAPIMSPYRTDTTSILYWYVFIVNLESLMLLPLTPRLGCIATVCSPDADLGPVLNWVAAL
jgi:hypothetical protein